MKRFICLFLVFVSVLTVFVSCGEGTQKDVIISNGTEEIVTKDVFLWSGGADGAAMFEGVLGSLKSDGSLDSLPQIEYKKGMSISLPKNTSLDCVKVYSMDNIEEYVKLSADIDVLSQMEAGEWYVVCDVKYYRKNKYSGKSAYVFKLIVEQEISE